MKMIELFHVSGGESIKVPFDAVGAMEEKGWLPAKTHKVEQQADIDADTQEIE